MAESIKVTLELDNSGFLTGITAAQSEVTKLGDAAKKSEEKHTQMFGKLSEGANEALSKLKELAVVYIGIEAIKGALELGDTLHNLSEASGVSVASILQLQEALRAAGGHAEDAGKLLGKLSVTMDQAGEGSAIAQDKLRRLGFTLHDMTNLSPEEALKKTVSALANITNEQQRMALAFDILGRKALTINWKEVNKDLAENSEKNKEAAAAAEKAHEVMKVLDERIKSLKVNLMIALSPMKDLIDYMEQLSGKGSNLEILKTIFQTIAVLIANVGFVLKTVFTEVKFVLSTIFDDFGAILEVSSKILQGDLSGAKSIWTKRSTEAANYRAELDKTQAADRKALDELEKRVLNPAKPKEDPAKPKLNMPDAPNASAGAIASIEKIAQAYAFANEKQRENIQLGYDNIGLSAGQQKIAQEQAKITQTGSDALIKLGEAYAKLTPLQQRAGEGTATLNAMKEVIATRDVDVEKIKKQILANEEYQRSFGKGWSDAFNAYVTNATNAASQAQAMFNVVTNAMNSAIDTFVMKGTFSFKNFSQGIIQEILKIQLKAAAANLIGLSGLGSLFGVPGKAAGGPVDANSPYLVGENGPELFMPKGAGTIVPNNQLGSSGGSTTIINNISAIDSKSVAQLFAENRMTLFGTVEQARRELPMRTR